MSKIIPYLTQLDLSDIQAHIYLKLLSSGTITMSELAKLIDIKRTTVYLHVNSLIEKGLAVRIVKGTKKFIAATEPDDLGRLIEEKALKIDSLKKEFPDMLKMIKQHFPTAKQSEDVETRTYKGKYHARRIYEEAFKAKEVRSYARIDPTDRLYPDNAIMFKNAFRDNKDLKWWEFLYDPTSAIEITEQIAISTDRYFYKFMPEYLKLSSEDILIFDGKVAIINYRQEKTSIVLQSEDFYNIMKEIFDFMWQSLVILPTK